MYHSLQGNVGLGSAIAYFTSHSIPVCLPLNDTQKYDIVVEIDGEMKKVQIKTSRQKTPAGGYAIQLKNSGGSSGKSVIRNFDNTLVDYVFVLTGNSKKYLIPSSEITSVSQISIGPTKYLEYEVFDESIEKFIE